MVESPHATVIETALFPVNEGLTRLVRSSSNDGAEPIISRNHHREDDILRILTLMASIRTRALERGWEAESDADLRQITAILQNLESAPTI